MKLFLTHRIDVFGFNIPLFFGIFENNLEKYLSIYDVINYKHEIITYQTTQVINELRKVYNGVFPHLSDISQLKKLNTCKSKKTFSQGTYPWNFWNMLKNEIGVDNTKKLFEELRESTPEDDVTDELRIICNKLKSYYSVEIKELKKTGQLKRYLEIENKIEQVLNQRQILGISIDIDKYEVLLSRLENSKNSLIKNLRFKYGITDLNYKSIRSFLISKGHMISIAGFDYSNLISYLKIQRISSELCNDIYNTLRVKSDYNGFLKYILENKNLIYPEFDCIGTITSRILVRYPNIQQLKRENRNIFKAKDHYTLLYCDYKQFEPGILASLSKDKIMKRFYNSGDIYEEFSLFIFNNKTLRKEAKVLFLSYLYGMSNPKLTTSINRIIKSKGLKKNASATDFFSKFKNMEKFKEKYTEISIDRGFVKSSFSLRRNLKLKNNNKAYKSEERFVLSQIIQGTASYILKKSILDCMNDKKIEFLIPMHDAVLFQVPSLKIEEKKILIEKAFVDNFKKVCPDINARVDFKSFDE